MKRAGRRPGFDAGTRRERDFASPREDRQRLWTQRDKKARRDWRHAWQIDVIEAAQD